MAGSPENRGSEARRPDQRPPIAVAMEWVSRITSVALMMVLPAWGGHWLDGKLGTGPWLLSVAALGGLVLGMTQLMHMVDSGRKRTKGPTEEATRR